MGLSLILEQKQQLKLSPQLIQSFELMALPLTELQAKIQAAIETNPTLEIPDAKEYSLDSVPDYDGKKDQSDYDEGGQGYDSEASDRAQQFMENTLTEKETLQEHLLGQLGCVSLTDEEYQTGEALISNMDDNGFFRDDPAVFLKPNQLPFKDKLVAIIQGFDPSGVGVRDWKESVILQAKQKGLKPEEFTVFTAMVDHELESIRAGKTNQVAKNLGVDSEEVEALYAFLKTLTPYPGQGFASGPDQFVIPDLSIHQKDGKLVMQMNSDAIPTLTISPEYQQMAEQIDDKKTKQYIKEQISQANQLITQIDMRNDTLRKVAQVVLAEQSEFFLKGPKFLKPLTQKEVAEKIGVHETTVSRIANAKYVDTDWGIIPIKNLFSNAVGDGNQSKNSVKEIIREIIQEHQGEKALSDQKITDLLVGKGINVARRTVAKYRKELNIDSSFVRGS
jgi:RNA polymerase sigma-54 factor